jgi:hypothetical protein
MSAALRIANKRKAARVSTRADSARTSGCYSLMSGARTSIFGEGSAINHQHPESGAQDVVSAGPARRLDPTSAAVGSVLEPSDPSPPAASFVLPAPVLQATSSVLPSLDTIPVASNTRPGAPLANQGNNPYSCILDGQRPKDRSLMEIWAPLNRSFPQNQEL